MSGIGILVLAAGASKRLGHPKQLLPFRGRPLIFEIAKVAVLSGCQPVGVVLGAYAESIEPHLANLDVHIIYNEYWLAGMSSSIQCGLRELLAISPDLEAILLMVCDQPFVSPHLIHQLIFGYKTFNYPIVTSEYGGIKGVPALFHKDFFPNLAMLQGDIGAKSIIRQHHSHCFSIPFEQGAIDLDMPQDLSILSLLIPQLQVPL
uniref:MobA-like NTP transferase domain-containing protein n=1 Tax=Cyanothece sp. (strain PCC 7425 / ATCC 29141) TaxID=395961 RepID=B8HZF6_CYAP4